MNASIQNGEWREGEGETNSDVSTARSLVEYFLDLVCFETLRTYQKQNKGRRRGQCKSRWGAEPAHFTRCSVITMGASMQELQLPPNTLGTALACVTTNTSQDTAISNHPLLLYYLYDPTPF